MEPKIVKTDSQHTILLCKGCGWMWSVDKSMAEIISKHQKGVMRFVFCPMCDEEDIDFCSSASTNELISQYLWRTETMEPAHVVERILEENKQKVLLDFYL